MHELWKVVSKCGEIVANGDAAADDNEKDVRR